MEQAYGTPRISYIVDVDDEAETLPRRALSAERAKLVLDTLERPALSRRSTTLTPVMADATLERFMASPIADDSDELSAVASTRELHIRRVARFAAAALVAVCAVVLLVAGSVSRSQSFTLGMDRAARPVTDGELIGPETRAGETVYVDDVAVGAVPNVLTVKCGVVSVRVGKTGAVRPIDIPCGGRVTL